VNTSFLSKIAVMFAILIFGVSRADAGQFDVAGAGCVPDPSTISGGLYSQVNAAISFGSGKTGTIVLNCPITNASTITSANPTLTITYLDTSTSSGNKIEFTIYSVKKSNGSFLTFLDYDTDGGSCTQSSSVHTCSVVSLSAFDTANYYYIVQINMSRSSTLPAETFFGATVN